VIFRDFAVSELLIGSGSEGSPVGKEGHSNLECRRSDMCGLLDAEAVIAPEF
jgi:hypothetical protein